MFTDVIFKIHSLNDAYGMSGFGGAAGMVIQPGDFRVRPHSEMTRLAAGQARTQ